MKFHALGLLAIICLFAQSLPSAAVTNQKDVTALNALAQAWTLSISSWTGDPCDSSWLGVSCDSSNTMVTALKLPNQGILGILPLQIGNLVNLQTLDLSYNRNLTGFLPAELFNLTSLTDLYLQNCGFVGPIPTTLDNLVNLKTLAFNNNSLTGSIPSTIGTLANLNWFDISGNQLSGRLPVTLALLTSAKHFHLQGNNFSGPIQTGIFNSRMPLIHLLLNDNSFTGPIPADIGNLTQLDILRLDSNKFSSIPGTLANLATVTAVQLGHNKFTSDVPDLSNLVNIQVLDLGYNSFTPGGVPSWFSKFPNLASLTMEAANLEGQVPADIFSLGNLSTVMLGNNNLNGTLDLQKANPNLMEVDLQGNNISGLAAGSFSGTLNLEGNPICQQNPNQPDNACNPTTPSSSSLQPSTCGCTEGFASNPTTAPGSCLCAYPISGVIVFTALKVTWDHNVIPSLQSGFAESIPLITTVDQISISLVSNAIANISIFPNNAQAWDISQANAITAILSSKAIQFPAMGPYEYLPFGPYSPPGSAKRTGLSGGAKAGVAIGVVALALIILAIGSYAFVQKR